MSTGWTSREPRPNRGLTIHGPGTPVTEPRAVAGTGIPLARQAWAKAHLSVQVRTADALGSQLRSPASASSPIPSARASISSATVHTSAVAPCRLASLATCAAKSG